MSKGLCAAVMAGALVAAACGGPGSFSGSVSGTVLDVQDSVALLLSPPGDAGTVLGIALGDKFHLCNDLMQNIVPKNLTTFQLRLGNTDASGNLTNNLSSGTYTVLAPSNAQFSTGGNIADGIFDHTDSTCTSTLDPTGQNPTPFETASGTVKLTSVSMKPGGTTSGTFSVVFGTGDKATGSFNAAFCSMSMQTAMQPTCQ